jgi:NADPH-dependent F420 reductase
VKIGILGAGNVGGALGRGWTRAGHTVVFGVRDVNSEGARKAARESSAELTGFAAAAADTDIVVVALPFRAAGNVLREAGGLAGRIVVDTTNHLDWTYGLRLATGRSAAEEIQELVPSARVVKAFNTIGYEHMADPWFGDIAADMLVCGNDAGARRAVIGLAEDLGFRGIDVGDLTHARAVEHLAVLWIHLSTSGGMGRDIAFKVLSKSPDTTPSTG